MERAVLWALFLLSGAAFLWQLAARMRLVWQAPGRLSLDRFGLRVKRFFVDVLLQRQTIRGRPAAGVAHAFVFWGFLAFGAHTAIDLMGGLGLAGVAARPWFAAYRLVLTPFALLVLGGITFLLVRRVVVRPVGLGDRLSGESVVIGLLIATLMTTFLLTWRFDAASAAGRVNWWVHAVVVLGFLVLIPSSKHLHLLLAPVGMFLKSPELGTVPNLDFERDEVGLEAVRDLGPKTVFDAFSCVECGRCQVNCPAWGAGQALDPKKLVLQTRQALLSGSRETALASVYSTEVLWQCTTCGACEQQCPVGVEHLPLVIGARRGLVSNGEAPAYLAGLYSQLERRANVWGQSYDERDRFLKTAELEVFDPGRHDVLVWLGCAGAFEADFQQALRALFSVLRASNVRFGVLAKETCTGDTAKRTGNEFLFQTLAKDNIERLSAAGASGKTVLASCPHCVKTIGSDYAQFGFEARVVHSAVFVESLTRGMSRPGRGESEDVAYHDPCYLGRYQDGVREPRELLARVGARPVEPDRAGANPYCCGAGGGLLFANKEEAPGARMSDVRMAQLRETGAGTVVTACPFCSIMLKGAEQSRSGEPVRVVDLMTYVQERLGTEAGKTAGQDAPG